MEKNQVKKDYTEIIQEDKFPQKTIQMKKNHKQIFGFLSMLVLITTLAFVYNACFSTNEATANEKNISHVTSNNKTKTDNSQEDDGNEEEVDDEEADYDQDNEESQQNKYSLYGQEADNSKDDGKNSLTLSQQNAIAKAKQYIEYMPFSYNGLIKQLEYEGYSEEDSIIGADNCGANWNEEAYKEAEKYQELMPMSRKELYDQLQYEEFTEEQISYALDKMGI